MHRAWKMFFEVIGAEREFWPDERKAENPSAMCSVEYGMKLSGPVHVQNDMCSRQPENAG